MISVLIPARNEKYLQRTIRDVLDNAEGEIEIIAVLDGYWPEPPIQDDPRVILIHHTESIGQRQSINEAARIAKGKYVMKLDGHCAVDKGFDVKLVADCEYDWTVIPRMYNLDHETWKPKKHKRTDYMYIGLRENGELRAEYFAGGNRQPDNDTKIDDTMCCMGPCFFMHKDRFWELGGMDENHGGWGQMGIEVACKAWLSGGSLRVNKKTWFAHWFRGGGGPGFPYHISGKSVNKARDYSKDLWLNNKWPLQKRTFDWMVKKFNPPGWANADAKDELFVEFYRRIHLSKKDPKWRGVRVIKFPTDLILYEQVIWENRPDFIIDIGTNLGGSALMFADFLEMTGKGKVISIDIESKVRPEHPRVQYITGSSTDKEVVKQVKELVGDGSVMVVLDSDHSRQHVKWELYYYQHIVTKGQYLVVEDCYSRHAKPFGPKQAKDWFLSRYKGFEQTNIDDQFLVGMTREGWLRKL